MISKCPCKGCVPPNRSVNCHATCQLYLDWKEEYNTNMKLIKDSEYYNRLGMPLRPKRRIK